MSSHFFAKIKIDRRDFLQKMLCHDMIQEIISFVEQSDYVTVRLVSREFNDIILALCTNAYTRHMNSVYNFLPEFVIFMNLYEDLDTKKIADDKDKYDTCAIFSFSIGEKGRRVLVSDSLDVLKITYCEHPCVTFRDHYSRVYIDRHKKILYCRPYYKDNYMTIKYKYTCVVEEHDVVLDGYRHYSYDTTYNLEYVPMSELYRIEHIMILDNTKKAIVSYTRRVGGDNINAPRQHAIVDNVHLKLLQDYRPKK